MTIVSPRLFLILFFSSFLQAYILPVERVWQAQTSPNPPFPEHEQMSLILKGSELFAYELYQEINNNSGMNREIVVWNENKTIESPDSFQKF